MDVDAFDEFLQPLPDDRREAVKRWLNSSLKDCVACGLPIRVMDGHELRKEGLAHRSCPVDQTPVAPAEDLPLAVVARNTRSDWG